MNKSWIGVGLLASAAAAQAQSSVTIFGLMDVGYTRDGGSIASVRGLSTSGTANSRLGFRGTEDLGGGYKAEFWLETGFNVDSGAANQNTNPDNLTAPSAATGAGSLQFGRRATVSLVTPYGEVRLGRDIVPSFYTDFLSPFGVNSVGSDVSEQANIVGLVQQRTSNGIHYITPTRYGLTGHLHYAFGERPSNVTPSAGKKDGNYAGARLSFKKGPFEAVTGYGKLEVSRAVTGQNADRSEANVAAAYDFGLAKLSAEYSLQKSLNTVGGGFGSAGAASLAGDDTKGKTVSVGLSVPVGPGKVNLAYSRIEVENGHGAGTEPRAGKVSLGYIYNLSKRTALYTSAAHLKNSNGTATGATLTAAAVRVAGISGAIAGPNTSSTAYEAGIRHSF